MFNKKFKQDIIWTVIAFGFFAVTGFVLNIVVGRFYGPETLGVFNQVYALYIIVSQLVALGIKNSALKYVSQYQSNFIRQGNIARSSMLLTVCITLVCTAILFLLSPTFTLVFNSPDVTKGWVIALPGFAGYVINKTLLAIINGKRLMFAYSLAQISRYVMIIICLGIFIYLDIDDIYLPLVFSLPEIPMAFALWGYILSKLPRGLWYHNWIRRHMAFGWRSFVSVALAEINTRVDIIMIGFFMTDKAVGIYSVAALFAEGFAMLAVPLRDNLNPLITEYYSSGKHEQLRHFARKNIKLFYVFCIFAGACAMFIYPYILDIFFADNSFDESYLIFVILVTGIILSSGYLPMNMFLVQAGYPMLQTYFRMYTVLTNIALNAILIPYFGIVGAACGTAISFVASTLVLKVLVSKRLRLVI